MELLLKRPTSTSINTRWIAFHFDANKWQVAKFRYTNGKRTALEEDETSLFGTFFDYLVNTTNNGESWWVVGWNIYEALCKCGIYNAITSGKVKLARNQQDSIGDKAKYSRSKMYGCLICENPPTIIDCQLSNGARVKFLDLRNWGIEKEMIVDDFTDCTLQDVVQGIEDYICLVQSLKMGQLKQTAAAQGYYCYRLNHMKYDLWPDDEPAARRLERDSYYAGRCEAYQIGRLPTGIIHVDVTSMYSSFGRSKAFPTRLHTVYSRPDIRMIDFHNKLKSYIAQCTVNTRSPMIPLRIDKRVIYPVGRFVTTLAWPELKAALSAGIVQKIHWLAEYEAHNIFESYSNWYKESLDSLESLGLLHLKNALKFAVNASYGKFAARSRDWVDRNDDKACYRFDQWWSRHPKTGNVVMWRSIDGHVQYMDHGNDPTLCMPAISSTMSSYGRVFLWELMTCAGEENVFYVDTDGIMVNSEGFNRLKSCGHIKNGEFGKLRIREEACNVDIIGIKHYKFGERYVCAGIPIDSMVVNENYTEYSRHIPFDYSLWHDRPFDSRYQRFTRVHKQRYKHGMVTESGRVIPFEVGTMQNGHSEQGKHTGEASNYSILGGANTFSWQ